ncbi:MAG: hypothetical protein HZB39_21705 [Planctomycetes bacterium]|nr:hypothetical protein [Planctomycetota bacterium]
MSPTPGTAARRPRDDRYESLFPSICAFTCGAAIGAVGWIIVGGGPIDTDVRGWLTMVTFLLLVALMLAVFPAAIFFVASLWTMELRRRRAPRPLPTFVVALVVGGLVPVLALAGGEWLLTAVALAILSGVLLCRRPLPGP